MRNNYIIEQVQHNLTKDVKATPNDVRKYFSTLPEDSIPYVPMQVEAQIISINPVIPAREIEDVKRGSAITRTGLIAVSPNSLTLAIMNSEDDGSAMQGWRTRLPVEVIMGAGVRQCGVQPQ